MTRIIILMMCALGCTATSQAQSSRLIPFQGSLTDVSGKPIADGARLIQFQIFGEAAGGSPLWAGEVHRTTVNGGLVNVVLGSKNPLPTDRPDNPSRSFFDASLYLQITVDTDTNGVINQEDPPLLPRQAILPVVFAQEAGNSRTLAGSDWKPLFGVNTPGGTILPAKIPAAAIDETKIAPAAVTRDKLASGILPAMVGWQSVPVTVFALDGVTTAKSRRVGENAEFVIDVHFNSDTHDQIASSSGFSLDIPYTIEFAALPTQNRLIAGSWHSRYVNGDQTSGVCIIGAGGVGASRVGVVIPGNRIPDGIRYNHQCEFSVILSVPVAGWKAAE